MFKLIVKNTNTEITMYVNMGNIKYDYINSKKKIEETELYEKFLDNNTPKFKRTSDGVKIRRTEEDRALEVKQAKIVIGLLKGMEIYYKLKLLLFNTLLDKKDLSKILPLIKNKLQENFSVMLEMFQEQVDNGLANEGHYLRFAENSQETYEMSMEEIILMEKIVAGWDWSFEEVGYE